VRLEPADLYVCRETRPTVRSRSEAFVTTDAVVVDRPAFGDATVRNIRGRERDHAAAVRQSDEKMRINDLRTCEDDNNNNTFNDKVTIKKIIIKRLPRVRCYVYICTCARVYTGRFKSSRPISVCYERVSSIPVCIVLIKITIFQSPFRCSTAAC